MAKKKRDQITENLDYIFDLYMNQGHTEYHGEPVSVLEHSVQAAMLAQKAKSSNYVILAAFLHDIGHLLIENVTDKMANYGHISHEKIGANKILELGFSEKIASLILNHVQAKRYLVAKFPSYFEKLSEASIETLERQGGKMDSFEMKAFEHNETFKNSLLLRIWDDEAKVPNEHIPDISYFYNLAYQHLKINRNH
jgi:2-amino-1-hydroxyethylphosphonate dioxygenase (glycine-forming)